jgi:hypothetical protein
VPADILLLTIVRAVVEVAGMMLLGQGVLWLFGPKGRDGNFVYDLFKKGTYPIVKATRVITPRFVHDAHVGFVAFFILIWLWFGLAVAKHYMCTSQGLQCA